MEFSIIINTHNQYQYLKRCILSCKKQDFDKDKFEIIICDTSTNIYKNFYSEFKNLKIIVSKEFSNFPCINQFENIKKAFKLSKGKIICLLDGDDFFHENKLNYIYKNFNQKIFINQDLPTYYLEDKNKLIFKKKNNLKKNQIYNKLINNWPSVLGTSCISLNRSSLEFFFKNYKNDNFNFLAIDTLLINFAKYKNILSFAGKKLTFKSINYQNLDKNFSKILSKNYWIRRYQQHKFINEKYKKYLNFDSLISYLFYYFLKR